jgi:hypothetical protein
MHEERLGRVMGIGIGIIDASYNNIIMADGGSWLLLSLSSVLLQADQPGVRHS